MYVSSRMGRAGAAVVGLLLGTFVATKPAHAGTITLEHSDYWSHGTNGGWSYTAQGGGEFRVFAFDGTADGITPAPFAANAKLTGSLFQTFCIEYTEEFSPGYPYHFSVDTAAIGGGSSGQDVYRDGHVSGPFNADSLDARTAYLYTQFWYGILDNYHWGLSASDHLRVDSAAALQLAIWKLEGELAAGSSRLTAYNANAQAKAWVTEADHAVNGYTDAGGYHAPTWTGLGHVRVLNLYHMSGRTQINDQSQLVVVAPLPAAAWAGLFLLSGLGAVGAWRRRRRLAQAL